MIIIFASILSVATPKKKTVVMKKDYKRPSIEVVKIEQSLMLPSSPHDTVSDQPSYAPGYGGKGRGRGRYDEDDFDEEEED